MKYFSTALLILSSLMALVPWSSASGTSLRGGRKLQGAGMTFNIVNELPPSPKQGAPFDFTLHGVRIYINENINQVPSIQATWTENGQQFSGPSVKSNNGDLIDANTLAGHEHQPPGVWLAPTNGEYGNEVTFFTTESVSAWFAIFTAVANNQDDINQAELYVITVHGFSNGTMVADFLQGEGQDPVDPQYTCPDVPHYGSISYDSDNCNSKGLQNFMCPSVPWTSNDGRNACLPQPKSGTGFSYQIEKQDSGTNVTLRLKAAGFDSGAYMSEWKQLGNGITETLSISTTWSSSETTTTGQTVSSAFSLGIQESVSVGFEGDSIKTSLSATATHTVTDETSHAVSVSESTSETNTCATQNCPGYLYQSKTLGTQWNGDEQSIESCYFSCVPMELSQTEYWPACPAGSCATDICNCCNVKISDNMDPKYLSKAVDGGECVPMYWTKNGGYANTTEADGWVPPSN